MMPVSTVGIIHERLTMVRTKLSAASGASDACLCVRAPSIHR
ncbi:MAG: hypothetical protein OJF52_000438 [Nitrospira sp.]|nr:MAG: hypothetical protein OJF52_000438 [Nitrospira sp.]